MATGKTSGSAEFLEFLKSAPTLDEATSQKVTELTGIVSRTSDGKFAITVSEGQTYELDAGAVQRFRAVDGPGFSKVATIQITSDALKEATLRPIKPLFKDVIKDPIKEIIHDGKFPPFDKPPYLDKPFPIDTLGGKDLHTDPVADLRWPKQLITDPREDDIRKDWTSEPPKSLGGDPITGAGDVQIPPDPIDQVINPAYAAAGQGPMPFAMATPHHAPQHLLAMQMGGAGAAAAHAKPLPWDKHPWSEKVSWSDRPKPMVIDTRKEIIRETIKEMAFDPPTFWEGVQNPGLPGGGPFPEPWAGGGMPGYM
jgi:hypothetical protein